MRHFSIIKALDATAGGPVRQRDKKPVHLRQGDADGACGPYCVFIALLTLGLVKDRDYLGPGKVPDDQETNDLLTQLSGNWGGLFPKGIELDDMHTMLAGCYPARLSVDGPSSGGVKCVDFVTEHLKREHVVILEIAFDGGSHFVVAIGLVMEDERATWLLTLDPNQPPSALCPWNGLIYIRDVAGRESKWRRPTGGEQRVKFKGAIALSLKDAE